MRRFLRESSLRGAHDVFRSFYVSSGSYLSCINFGAHLSVILWYEFWASSRTKEKWLRRLLFSEQTKKRFQFIFSKSLYRSSYLISWIMMELIFRFSFFFFFCIFFLLLKSSITVDQVAYARISHFWQRELFYRIWNPSFSQKLHFV